MAKAKLTKKQAQLRKITNQDLAIDYHLQGYTAQEIAEQLSIEKEEVLGFIDQEVSQAAKEQITEKKEARQVELMRIDEMMAHLSSQFENAEDDENPVNGTLRRDGIKATCYLVDRMAKLINLKAKLLNLYDNAGELKGESKNRLLALDYREVSDDELAQLYADTFNETTPS